MEEIKFVEHKINLPPLPVVVTEWHNYIIYNDYFRLAT